MTMRRSKAREIVFQLLYQDDLNPRANPAAGDALLVRRLRHPELIDFARELLAEVRRNRRELDKAISEAAEHWSLERMAATDRNILRLAAWEILWSDVPDRAAINEAIELAKRYGTAQSAAFVNGILDRLMHSKQQANGPPADAAVGPRSDSPDG